MYIFHQMSIAIARLLHRVDLITDAIFEWCILHTLLNVLKENCFHFPFFNWYIDFSRNFSPWFDVNSFLKYFCKKSFKMLKGPIRSRESIKDKQHNGQQKKDKMTNSDIYYITQKTKNWATNPVISHDWGKGLITITKNWTYPWSFVTHIFHNNQVKHAEPKGIVYR